MKKKRNRWLRQIFSFAFKENSGSYHMICYLHPIGLSLITKPHNYKASWEIALFLTAGSKLKVLFLWRKEKMGIGEISSGCHRRIEAPLDV